MNDLGFFYTYTPVYSPQFNGIEEAISQLKRVVKNRRLDLIMANQTENLE